MPSIQAKREAAAAIHTVHQAAQRQRARHEQIRRFRAQQADWVMAQPTVAQLAGCERLYAERLLARFRQSPIGTGVNPYRFALDCGADLHHVRKAVNTALTASFIAVHERYAVKQAAAA